MVIAPTVTAYDLGTFMHQIDAVKRFADRVHIDLMDGEFAPTESPSLQDIRWPHHLTVDIHLMYQRPMEQLQRLIHLKPHMVIVHAEAEVHHMHFAAELHKHDIEVGLSILQETPVANIKQIMHSFDHVLLFSGHLGFHGGEADLGLLHKAHEIKDYYPDIELGWDGGINDHNIVQLVDAGISVLNVGGFIQKSDNPEAAYATLWEKLK